MATDKAPTKRRSVSKPRLYKELEATVKEHGFDPETINIQTLLNAIKDDWFTEAQK